MVYSEQEKEAFKDSVLSKPRWIVLYEHGNDVNNTVFCFSCKKFVEFTEQEYNIMIREGQIITMYKCKSCRDKYNEFNEMMECFLIQKKPC